jgi:hypothetical protein
MFAYTSCVKFSEFITSKYVEWRGAETGNKKSIARYARDVLGITPQLLSEWMNRGKIPTDENYVRKLIELFAPEIYGVDEFLVPISFDSIPSDKAERLMRAFAEINVASREQHISDPNSPEGKALASLIFEKHGFKDTINQ